MPTRDSPRLSGHLWADGDEKEKDSMRMVTERAAGATLTQKSKNVTRQRRSLRNDVMKAAGEQPMKRGRARGRDLCPRRAGAAPPPGVWTSSPTWRPPCCWGSMEASSRRRDPIITPFPAPDLSWGRGQG